MGAHRDNGIVHALHAWKQRAKRAEARVAELEHELTQHIEAAARHRRRLRSGGPDPDHHTTDHD